MTHTHLDCKYHIVSKHKKRKKHIYGAIRMHLGEVLHELAKRRGVVIEEGHLMPDHIHMCISEINGVRAL